MGKMTFLSLCFSDKTVLCIRILASKPHVPPLAELLHCAGCRIKVWAASTFNIVKMAEPVGINRSAERVPWETQPRICIDYSRCLESLLVWSLCLKIAWWKLCSWPTEGPPTAPKSKQIWHPHWEWWICPQPLSPVKPDWGWWINHRGPQESSGYGL